MDINKIQEFVEKDGIVFLAYGGFLSQSLIAGWTEALEKEATANGLSMGISSNIFTIFIELAQNVMNYSKSVDQNNDEINPEGLIVVSKSEDLCYYVHSQNIISKADKEKLEVKLQDIESLDTDGIKKRYKELRRSGRDTHGKGGGIGLYEIAKRSNELHHEFKKINDDRYYYYLKATIHLKK